MSVAVQPDGASHSLLDGRYPFGPFLDRALADAIPDTRTMITTTNHARDAEDSTTGERVSAGYGMAEIYFGQKLLLLPGVRVEHLSADYVANEVQFSPAGAWLSTKPIEGTTKNTQVLPDVLLKYTATPDTIFRGAVTRTLARPNYLSQIPNRQLDDQANTLTLGN